MSSSLLFLTAPIASATLPTTFTKPYQVPLAKNGWCSHQGAIRQDVPGCGIVCSDKTHRGVLKKNIWWEDVPCSLCPKAEWTGCPTPTHEQAALPARHSKEWKGQPRTISDCTSNYGNLGDTKACRKAFDSDLSVDFFFNGFLDEVSSDDKGMAWIEFSLQREDTMYDTVGGLALTSGRFGTYAITSFDVKFKVVTETGATKWVSPANMKVVNKMIGQANGGATVAGGQIGDLTYTDPNDTGLILSFDTIHDVAMVRLEVHSSDRSVQHGFFETVLVSINVFIDHPHLDTSGAQPSVNDEFDEFVSSVVLPFGCQPEFCERWGCNGEVSWCACWKEGVDYPKCVDNGESTCQCD